MPHDLHNLRRERWRLNGRPLSGFDDAREFVESAGLVLLAPASPPVALPTMVGATLGGDAQLPDARRLPTDPRGQQARALADELVRRKAAVESNIFPDNGVLVAPSLFPYFYTLLADREGGARREPLSRLADAAGKLLEREGPLTTAQLREKLGAEVSTAAVDRAMTELWTRLRALRIGRAADGALWETPQRWLPEGTRQGAHTSAGVALSALISRYLDSAVAAEQSELEDVFSRFAPRSRVRESVNALLAARELSLRNLGKHTLLEITPARTAPSLERRPAKERPPRRA
ncbi:MAG TPA: hypothetical protein VFA60_13100 [Terriglobales bacterium]|nr:hypothetical protein [Terriglobales bacterium]